MIRNEMHSITDGDQGDRPDKFVKIVDDDDHDDDDV